MNQVEFTTWLATGSYGGLAFSVVAAAGIAVFALRLRRGTPRQLARAILVCLFACCLSFAPIWWEQTRFDLLGPTLAPAEVAFWLGWAALFAWGVPLGTAAGYLLLAAPQPATGRVVVPPPFRAPLQFLGIGAHFVELRDPRRLDEPLGPGRAWGELTPLQGPFAGRPIALSHAVVVIGRESDCDLVVKDELASRHHAELRWEQGHVVLIDCGSLNGTRLNGQGIAGQVPLHAGDVLEVGDERYRFDPRASGPGGSSVRAPLADLAGMANDPDETHKVAGAGRRSQASLPLGPALRLIAVGGPEPGRAWVLAAPLITIGREPASDICLPDRSVSRPHAQIVRQASGYYLQDLGSENGTRLDGQELTGPVALHPGAVLTIGDVTLRCEAVLASMPPTLDQPAEQSAAPPAEPPAPLDADMPPAAPTAAWGTPVMQHLMAARSDERDRPRLGPPRLYPDQPDQPDQPR